MSGRRLAARADALDERLRALLLSPVGRLCGYGAAVMTAAAFLLLMMTRTFVQLQGAGMALRLGSVLLLSLPALLSALAAVQIVRTRGGSLLDALLGCALCGAAMLARVSFIERSSGDYDIYLAKWIELLAGQSFAQSMRGAVGEYNVLYQYILYLITRLPVVPLYAVKAVSFMGDAMLAAGMARLCARDGKPSMAAFAAALLLPAAVLNGGMFAQCDSLYAGCAVWALALALEGRHTRSAVCFALSLCFKLQAVFLLPMVVVLWAGRRLRLADAGVFLLTILAVMLPAMLAGKSPAAILQIYTAQTGLYSGLTYSAPSLFGLIHTEGLDVYAYGNFGMALAFGACLALLAYGAAHAQQMDEDDHVRLGFLLVTAIVFLLPRMHDRYFYLADMLAAALACRDRRYAPAAVMMALASLSTLWLTPIPLWGAALLVLAAWTWAAGMGKAEK